METFLEKGFYLEILPGLELALGLVGGIGPGLEPGVVISRRGRLKRTEESYQFLMIKISHYVRNDQNNKQKSSIYQIIDSSNHQRMNHNNIPYQ